MTKREARVLAREYAAELLAAAAARAPGKWARERGLPTEMDAVFRDEVQKVARGVEATAPFAAR